MIAVTPEMIEAVTNCATTVSNAKGIAIPTATHLLSCGSEIRNAIIIAVTIIVGICASSDSFKN